MRLLPIIDEGIHESKMQRELAELIEKQEYPPSDPAHPSDWYWIKPKVYKEVNIPNIGRRSDLVVYLTDRKIINIECKLKDYSEVINQAKDHALWANYSYIAFHADSYIPAYAIEKMLKNGLGLILYRKGEFFEVIQAKYQKGTDKAIRTELLKKLRFFDSQNTAHQENKRQTKFEL